MGMFDYITCKMKLPDEVADVQTHSFQTKDTPAQALDSYEIHEDGTLWHENYDIEDHSDPTKSGIERLAGMLTHVNKRTERVILDGSLDFYSFRDEYGAKGWVEIRAVFIEGVVSSMTVLRNER